MLPLSVPKRAPVPFIKRTGLFPFLRRGVYA